MSGTLSVVATPIGNLADLSARAVEVLRSADLVLAEDTRHTGRLLAHVGSTVPQRSLHEHNERARVDEVLALIEGGAHVALVTDAGTPLISDPGLALVRACSEAGMTVVPIPGASAVLAALVASGLASDRVAFDGFLPRRGGSRTARLEELADEPRTVVLFLSPHRAAEDLADLAAACGDTRPAALCRELTKLHEEIRRGTLATLRQRGRWGPRRAHARHRRRTRAGATGRRRCDGDRSRRRTDRCGGVHARRRGAGRRAARAAQTRPVRSGDRASGRDAFDAVTPSTP